MLPDRIGLRVCYYICTVRTRQNERPPGPRDWTASKAAEALVVYAMRSRLPAVWPCMLGCWGRLAAGGWLLTTRRHSSLMREARNAVRCALCALTPGPAPPACDAARLT
jgi:hypothetical protein